MFDVFWLISPQKVLEETKFGRDFVFKKARESVMSKTGGVYPAPLKVCAQHVFMSRILLL
jgi:hypothetical protein